MNALRCLAFGFLVVVTFFGCNRILSDICLFEAIHFSKKGDWPRALSLAKEAYRINPHDKRPLSIIGIAHILTRDLKAGIVILEKYTESYPYDFGVLVNLGLAYLLADRDQEADMVKARVKWISPKHVERIKLKNSSKLNKGK